MENGYSSGSGMNIRIKLSALRETRWHEYLIRFVLGGLATVGTGAIASLFGPETGGLFLAFPAIFCASATLVEKHERERKEEAGLLERRSASKASGVKQCLTGAATTKLFQCSASENSRIS